VKEVALTGAADLAFWHAALRPHGLAPFDGDGAAHLTIRAPQRVRTGLRFRE
jgi:hypothetical protein